MTVMPPPSGNPLGQNGGPGLTSGVPGDPLASSVSADRASQHVAIIDAMRGMASLAVAWFHIAPPVRPPGTVLFLSAAYGWLGVPVFFVISGFVLPAAMLRSRYALCDGGRFLLKRLLRVDPPYIASMLLVVGIAFVFAHAPGSRAVFNPPSLGRVLLHAGYAVPFVPPTAWLNPAYWTLAIEFQYYLLIAALFPLVASRREQLAQGVCVVLLGGSLVLTHKAFFPAHAGLFVLGLYCFRLRSNLSSPGRAGLMISASIVTIALTRGMLEATAGALAAGVIIFYDRWFSNRVPRGFVWLGSISYSLYLIHGPVGENAAVVLRHLLPRTPAISVHLLALAIAVIAASVFCQLFEKPAIRMAGRVRYHTQQTGAAPAPPL
jgi:peptidoglycan/LPS O-acetylase OafA/YrhL